MDVEQQIEALLFYKGEPVSTKELSILLDVSEEEVLSRAKNLEITLKTRGLRLGILEDTLELRTAGEMSDIILKLQKADLSRSLGKAGSETLAIILYKGPIARAEIDYIRGVNSTFILRNLLIRGLIEKVPNPRDQRSYLYKTTHELLAHLGITNVKELP